MLALPIKLKSISETIINQYTEDNLDHEGEGWPSDVYKILLTAEEIENLAALSKEYPDIVATDNTLDLVV